MITSLNIRCAGAKESMIIDNTAVLLLKIFSDNKYVGISDNDPNKTDTNVRASISLLKNRYEIRPKKMYTGNPGG
jgi:hypothetical protein